MSDDLDQPLTKKDLKEFEEWLTERVNRMAERLEQGIGQRIDLMVEDIVKRSTERLRRPMDDVR